MDCSLLLFEMFYFFIKVQVYFPTEETNKNVFYQKVIYIDSKKFLIGLQFEKIPMTYSTHFPITQLISGWISYDIAPAKSSKHVIGRDQHHGDDALKMSWWVLKMSWYFFLSYLFVHLHVHEQHIYIVILPNIVRQFWYRSEFSVYFY